MSLLYAPMGGMIASAFVYSYALAAGVPEFAAIAAAVPAFVGGLAAWCYSPLPDANYIRGGAIAPGGGYWGFEPPEEDQS